jgi:hypothetical protein
MNVVYFDFERPSNTGRDIPNSKVFELPASSQDFIFPFFRAFEDMFAELGGIAGTRNEFLCLKNLIRNSAGVDGKVA